MLATVLGIIEQLANTTEPTPLSELFPAEAGFRHLVGVKYRPRSDQDSLPAHLGTSWTDADHPCSRRKGRALEYPCAVAAPWPAIGSPAAPAGTGARCRRRAEFSRGFGWRPW